MEFPNEHTRNRPLSDAVVDPLPPALWPARVPHAGRFVNVEPLDARVHAHELYQAGHGTPESERIWDYLPYGPFGSSDAFAAWLRSRSAGADPLFFAIRDRATGRASGMASFLNIVPIIGTLEIGHIWFGPDLQNSPAATEALFLMMSHVLDELSYRRLEWKCNALNRASRRAAVRLGFAFEGIFYQHSVVKGRNRDTAWFSILDDEWPAIRENFLRWLVPDNFDEEGRQLTSLSEANIALRQI
jgi:RimJ/RimL family protein N-acetyltransferase